MASIVSTGLLTKGLRSEFFNALAGVPSAWERLATRITSNASQETYRWLGTVPNMREFGTGRQAKGLRTESYSVENQKYEATIEVDRDELMDDQTGQINVRIRELAARAATHKDSLIATLLESGGDTGFNSYDGVTFFNTAHVSGASGNQDNALTPAATDADAPTTAEFQAALKAAIAAIRGFKDDQGLPMALSSGGLVAVVPPSMEFAAREALNATIIANTSNVMVGAADVLPFPWLTATDTWYLLKTDAFIRPFILQDREPIEFTAVDDPDSDEAFRREKYLYGVRARYAMTYGYWQFAVRNVFTE